MASNDSLTSFTSHVGPIGNSSSIEITQSVDTLPNDSIEKNLPENVTTKQKRKRVINNDTLENPSKKRTNSKKRLLTEEHKEKIRQSVKASSTKKKKAVKFPIVMEVPLRTIRVDTYKEWSYLPDIVTKLNTKIKALENIISQYEKNKDIKWNVTNLHECVRNLRENQIIVEDIIDDNSCQTRSYYALGIFTQVFNKLYSECEEKPKKNIMNHAIRTLLSFDNGLVKEEVKKEFYISLRFNPVQVAQALDKTSLNQTNIKVINQLQDVQTKVYGRNNGPLLPSSNSIKLIRKTIEVKANELFTPVVNNSNASFQYDVRKFLEVLITKYKLVEKYSADGKLLMKIASSWDGTDFGNKNLFIWGLKMIQFLEEISAKHKKQSRDNVIPIGTCFQKDVKENLHVIRSFYNTLDVDLKNNPIIVKNTSTDEDITVCFECKHVVDLKACWGMTGQGGAMGKTLYPCALCPMKSDYRGNKYNYTVHGLICPCNLCDGTNCSHWAMNDNVTLHQDSYLSDGHKTVQVFTSKELETWRKKA